MPKPLVCEIRKRTFNVPVEKSIYCHHIEEQNVCKNLKFAFNNCPINFTAVCFRFCTFYQFPSADSILEHCRQITVLVIQSSKLSRIESDDLKGLQTLKELHINYCEIEELPGDLFEHTPNLEIVGFYGNKIKYVGEGLLTPLKSLKYFDLRKNSGISYLFNNFTKTGSIQELKTKLGELKHNSELKKKLEAKGEEIDTLKTENENLKTRCQKLEAKTEETAALQTRCKNLEDQLKMSKDEMKVMKETIEKNFETLNKRMQQMQEAAKNFVVIINETKFKVQKEILKAHSKTLKELIDANPETEILELAEVSEAVFAEILNFMHLGCPPTANVDPVELFGASCRLEIDALTPIAARMLQDKINPENALKILILCNKYKNHEQLKAKAFEEFKKNFPLYTFKPELASQPSKLQQLWKAMQEMDKP